LDGQQQHAVRPVQPDYGHGLYIRAYNSMFAGTGKLCKDEGLYISRRIRSVRVRPHRGSRRRGPLQSRASGKRPPIVEIFGGARQHRHRCRLREIRERYRGGSRQERRLRLWCMNTEEIDRILRRQCARDFDGIFNVDTLPDRPRLLVCNTNPSYRRSRRIFRFVRTSTSAEFERCMNRHRRYWTFNDKQLQSVVSQFCGYYCICHCLYRSSGIDMRKIVCSFTSDTALNDVLVHALVCRIRKKTNAFQMHKRLFYSTCTHTQTHTHTY